MCTNEGHEKAFVCRKASQGPGFGCSVVSDSLQPYRLQSASLRLCPRDFLQRAAISISRGIFQTQGSNRHLLCLLHCRQLLHLWGTGFRGGSDSKESTCNVGDLGSIPGLGRFLAEGNGYPLQHPCLENSMDWGFWQGCKELDITEWLLLSHVQISLFSSVLCRVWFWSKWHYVNQCDFLLWMAIKSYFQLHK